MGVLRKKRFVGDMKCAKNNSREFPPWTEVDFTYNLVEKLDEKSVAYMLENINFGVRYWKDKHVSITDTHVIVSMRELDFAVGDMISFGTVEMVGYRKPYICDFTEDKLIRPYGTFMKFWETNS